MKIVKKIFNKKNIKWFAVILLIIVVILFFVLRKKTDEFVVEDHDLYQYLTGIKVEYTGSIKMNKSDNDKITMINFKDDVTVDLDSTPIYYKDENKVLFPKNMAVLKPTEGTQFKINYYSTLEKEKTGIYVKDRDLHKYLVNAVLYDGRDIYFFIDKVKVSIGDDSYDLDPLSYIVVDEYNKIVYLYNKTTDKMITIDGNEDEVIISTKNYKINASLDVMYYNKKSKLLIKDISVLKNLAK